MLTINILEDSLISKIAAGEVIERPASVVKELVENSIDSNVENITINVKNDNLNIEIIDDGDGMSEDDLKLCLTRHATSKIKDVKDLFNINSLGFRGEALASIASVAKVNIITKRKDDNNGYKLSWNGTEQIIEEIGAQNGALIQVKNLFYNMPVRKKFLKSGEREFKEILDIITRFALYYHNISFKLTRDDKIIFKSNKSHNPVQAIINVYGKDTARNMLIVASTEGSVKIKGFISKPPTSRSNKEAQNIFVNGRKIKNKIITDAIYEGYHSQLFNNRHPIFLLKIDINPELIDVNVHPTKKEIRLKDETYIRNLISTIIFDALTKDTLKQRIKKSIDNQSKITSDYTEQKEIISNVMEKPAIDYSTKVLDHARLESQENLFSDIKVKSRDYIVLGQVKKCFIIVENQDGMLIIDQHTAEERIYYDKLMKQFENDGIQKQKLLYPIMIELPAVDAEVLNQNIKLLEKYGFNIEPFGQNSFQIRTVPVIFQRIQDKNTLKEIIDDLLTSAKSSKLDNIKEDIITSMSCRAAIKKGDTLTAIQMYELMDKLFSSTFPNTCPHGRPIIIQYTTNDLEKMFNRK